MAEALNRPIIDGRAVEGPEPFMDNMTIMEGMVIGAIPLGLADEDPQAPWQRKGYTNDQRAKLVEFRELYPRKLGEGTTYPYDISSIILLMKLAYKGDN